MVLSRVARRILSKAYGHARYQRHFRWLHHVALQGQNIGGTIDVAASGEARVIELLLRPEHKPPCPVVFDVGANHGEWAELALSRIGPDLRLHAFEPSKSVFNGLQSRFASSNIKLWNFGLGERDESVTLYSDAQGSGLASVFNRHLEHFNLHMQPQETVRLRRLDDFCRENAIEKIHLLKVDVEGNELFVFKGAGDLIANGKAEILQFEFGGTNIDSRTYFRDFWELLTPKYRLYRILKDGFAKIDKYSELEEVFLMTNFLAVSTEIAPPV